MSEEQNSGQEKSHEASRSKLERARRKGEMARSQDAQTLAAYAGLAAAALAGGAWSALYLAETLTVFLARPDELAAIGQSAAGPGLWLTIMGRIGGAAAPLVMLPAALVLALLVAQRAIVLAPEKLKFRLSRISPVQNAKQKYGPHGLVEFVKSGVKLIAVGIVLGWALTAEMDALPGYARIDGRHLPALLEAQFWTMMLGILGVAAVIAVIDLAWQRHGHLKRMRMTHQELKDEQKQAEGDPYMRATRRDRAREIANNRMLHDVPKADVVITNPTHYAVALKWQRAGHAVPVCLAKGEDEMARRIRHKAEQAGVPIHEDPPTARSIHALVEVGQPIAPEHYKAVAAAVVFADRMRAAQRARGTGA